MRWLLHDARCILSVGTSVRCLVVLNLATEDRATMVLEHWGHKYALGLPMYLLALILIATGFLIMLQASIALHWTGCGVVSLAVIMLSIPMTVLWFENDKDLELAYDDSR